MNWKEAAKLVMRVSPLRNPFGIAGAGLIGIGLAVIAFGAMVSLSAFSKTLSNPSITIPYVGEVPSMPNIPSLNIMSVLIPIGVGLCFMVIGGILIAFGAQIGQIMVLNTIIQNAFSIPQKELRLSPSQDQRLCPKCGSPIPKGFQYCLHCGCEVV